MTPGIKEIIILLLAIAALFLVPRMMRRRTTTTSATESASVKHSKSVGFMRLALFVSVLWIVAAALVFKPWVGNPILFLGVGLGPVAAGWGIRWVLKGFKSS